MTDAEIRAIPKWTKGSFMITLPVGDGGDTYSSSVNALTASAKASMSVNLAGSFTVGGVSKTYAQRKDYTHLSASDDTWHYASPPNSGSNGGGIYTVVDDDWKVVWSSVWEDFDTYVTASKVHPDDVKYNHPKNKGNQRSTGDSPVSPPGSTA